MKQKIILDIDSAGDDILAVVYAALHEEVDLLAVTCVKGAAGDIEQVSSVALHTIEQTGLDIPVYLGCNQELNPKPYAFEGDPVHFEEELKPILGDRIKEFNPSLRPQNRKPESMFAIDAMYQLLKQNPGGVKIVATGPLTNIATLFQKYPDAPELLESLYILGGVFTIPGNMTPVVEYNIFADPEAANQVFIADCPIYLVPLDICENNVFANTMLTRDGLDQWIHSDSCLAKNLAKRFEIYIDIWREYFDLVGFPLDDVMTVALAIHPEWFKLSDPAVVQVETEGRFTRGQTIHFHGKQLFKPVQGQKRNIRIAEWISGKEFLCDFIHVIRQNRG